MFEKAVKAELEAIRSDSLRYSERDLCSAYGVPETNRRWAKAVRKEADRRYTETASQVAHEPLPA
ncbi:hypothetical protein GCM10009642_62270 [Nocardiopsis metallicus]